MSENHSEQSQPSQSLKEQVPDPEVMAQAQRRQFSGAYKQRILAEADQCADPGAIGALLRREGLYSSHLARWRQMRAAGELQGLSPQPRGRKGDGQATELAQLRRENERLKQRLAQAELIIDVQKKLSQMLGLTLPPQPDDENK